MRVLVTGSGGLVGAQVVRDLRNLGHVPVLFDISSGDDILDLDALNIAATGCDWVIHSAAMLGKPGEDGAATFKVNVTGTWNVLSAARSQGVTRFVFLSSVNVIGVFKGQRKPDYFPVDDDHPKFPLDDYGVSKHLGEEMCRDIAHVSPMKIIALRPPAIWHEDTFAEIAKGQIDRPKQVYSGWEYGAFVDARDMSQACLAALVCEVDKFEAMLVCAEDVCTHGPTSLEMTQAVLPDVEVRNSDAFADDPYRALVDCSKAARILGVRPRYTWQSAIT